MILVMLFKSFLYMYIRLFVIYLNNNNNNNKQTSYIRYNFI